MTQDFYRAFEDRFRGSREEIKSRLSYYDPLLQTLKSELSTRDALDLGCGRGEWLEVLKQHGFQARGIDSDAGMLAACHEKNLIVEQGDALASLTQSADNSLAVVSAFHLVEHLPFEQVLELITQAHRALAPGGLLIMETPNSENIGVGTWNFYLDPTHQRPIPHLLLQFATEFGGFEFASIVRVNHDPNLAESAELGLLDVLCRASPDYAVIGMKSRTDGRTGQDVFADFWGKASGLALEHLAKRYDDKYSGAIRSLDADLFALRAQFDHFQEVEDKLLHQFSNDAGSGSELALEKFIKARQTAADRIDDLERSHETAQTRLADMTGRLDQLAQTLQTVEAELVTQRHEQAGLMQQLQDVYGSTSWRVTKPLRLAVNAIKQVLGRNDKQ